MNSNRILLAFVAILGVLLALLAAVASAQNLYSFVLGAIVFLGIGYVLFLNQLWIPLAFFYACLGFNIQPVGPSLAPLHITLAMSGVFLLSNTWRKRASLPGENTIRSCFNIFTVAFLSYSAYLAIQAFVTKFYPHGGLHVSWGNLAKQYVGMWGGFALVWITVTFLQYFKITKRLEMWMALGLLIGLMINLSLRLYGIFVLGIGSHDTITGETVGINTIFIPFLNLTDNIYALRSLGSLSVLFGIVILTSKEFRSKSSGLKLISALLVVLGFIGAVASMGRAALFLSFIYGGSVLFLRGRVLALAALVSLSILGIFGIRMFYEVSPQSVPIGIQRALAMIPGMNMPEAKSNIDSSSDWRYELAMRAWDEWASSTRTTLIGRGVYSYTERDEQVMARSGYYGGMDVALRRGATHNLVTDLLLTTGVIGALLYYLVLGSLLVATMRLFRLAKRNSIYPPDMLMIILIPVLYQIPLGLLGSGFFSVESALLLSASVLVLVAKLNPGVEQQSVPPSLSFELEQERSLDVNMNQRSSSSE